MALWPKSGMNAFIRLRLTFVHRLRPLAHLLNMAFPAVKPFFCTGINQKTMDTNDKTTEREFGREFQNRMERRIKGRMGNRFESKSGRILGGVVLLGIGALLIAHEMGADIPNWIFTWPMIPIAIGLFIGAKMNFRPDGWLIPIFIGCAFLLNNIMPELEIKNFIWPTIIIIIGLAMIFRPRKQHWGEYWNTDVNSTEGGDRIDMVSVFSGNKKMIITKDFRGGEAVSVFGGTELNLVQSDINGTVTLELTQVFGGAKLIVPSNWKIISSEVVSVFGSLEDKRQLRSEPTDETKVLRLIGTSVFGGVEIKSY
jgi:hypothetical protein